MQELTYTLEKVIDGKKRSIILDSNEIAKIGYVWNEHCRYDTVWQALLSRHPDADYEACQELLREMYFAHEKITRYGVSGEEAIDLVFDECRYELTAVFPDEYGDD